MTVKYAIVLRRDTPSDISHINVPEFNQYEHYEDLDYAVRKVTNFCAAKGIGLQDDPSFVGNREWIYSDASGDQQEVVKSWKCSSGERINICKVES